MGIPLHEYVGMRENDVIHPKCEKCQWHSKSIEKYGRPVSGFCVADPNWDPESNKNPSSTIRARSISGFCGPGFSFFQPDGTYWWRRDLD